MDKGPWVVSVFGDIVNSKDLTHGVELEVSGSFADDAEQLAYCQWLAGVLNAASNESAGRS